MSSEPEAPVLVTGASGTVGRHVCARLLDAGKDVRAAMRTPPVTEPEPQQADEQGLTYVPFDFTDPDTWATAYEGVTRMFVLRPPQLANVRRDMLPALRAAQDAGVEHMVLLSVQGVESIPMAPHAALERWLRRSGLSWTFVRPSFFMENLIYPHGDDIRDFDAITVPAGGGRTAFVSGADVGAVAAEALLDPVSHRAKAYTPTGPSALTYHAVAAILGDVLGRPISYPRPGLVTHVRHARGDLGMPWPLVALTGVIYTTARLGLADGLTTDVQQVTGQAPEPLRSWAARHTEVWRAAG